MTRTVLVTGASSGLGRATARLFQAEGWNVIASMRRPELETDLTSLERTFVPRLDVQDITSIRSAVEASLERFGRIDALINNAGYAAYGPLEATPLESIYRQFDVNVFGMMEVTKVVLPHFRANREGTIVNISSIGGRKAFPLGTLYHGSKFAVEGLSEALQYELAPLGIRVKIIEPGMINTDFAGRSFEQNNNPFLAEYQPVVQRMMASFHALMARASSPDAIARTVFAATVDERDRLRYPAGADAEQALAGRDGSGDTDLFDGMDAQFSLV